MLLCSFSLPVRLLIPAQRGLSKKITVVILSLPNISLLLPPFVISQWAELYFVWVRYFPRIRTISSTRFVSSSATEHHFRLCSLIWNSRTIFPLQFVCDMLTKSGRCSPLVWSLELLSVVGWLLVGERQWKMCDLNEFYWCKNNQAAIISTTPHCQHGGGCNMRTWVNTRTSLRTYVRSGVFIFSLQMLTRVELTQCWCAGLNLIKMLQIEEAAVFHVALICPSHG